MKNRIIKWLGGYTSDDLGSEVSRASASILDKVENKLLGSLKISNVDGSYGGVIDRIIDQVNNELSRTKADLELQEGIIKELESYIKPEYYVLHLPENGIYVPVREFKGVKEYLYTNGLFSDTAKSISKYWQDIKTEAKAQKMLEQWIELEKVGG